MNLRTPVILALDVDDFSVGLEMARKLKFDLGAIKVGPRLLMQRGAEVVAACSEIAPVFVDNKYFDIPSTMEAAVETTFDAGATFATVHALAGPDALARMAALEKRLSQRRPFKVLVVTVLTSFTAETLPVGLKGQSITTLSREMAAQALSVGLTGLVCSPHEVAELRKLSANAYLITPGIRVGTAKDDDQARVMTPKESLDAGADAVVIGRPILQAQDPKRELQQIMFSIRGEEAKAVQ